MHITTSKALRILGPLAAVLGFAIMASPARAGWGTASDITGLYYTGETASYGLQVAGGQDANWDVTYASTNGGSSESTSNLGYAYVITPSSVSGSGYTPNTSSAQWITAPGAYVNSSTSSAQNTGGDYLPGNGNSGSNEGIYVYTLAFQVEGTGSAGTAVTNNIQITMTLAADDQYSVYVNPSGNGSTVPTGTAAASMTSAWSNKTQISLQNYTGGGVTANSNFVIGTNYLVVVVDNTNSITGSSTSTALNPSGLLVYQTSDALVGGSPVPEVATWLPLVGAIGCYGIFAMRRRQPLFQAAAA
jgi:hypothetical protein